jgi:hypothetical protein
MTSRPPTPQIKNYLNSKRNLYLLSYRFLKKEIRVIKSRWAGYIIELDPKNPDIVPVMTKVTRGASIRTLFHLQEEAMCRRAAAYVLALSADGIPVLTRLLKEGDSWERQTAIFALDDLTETSNYPEGSIPAMKELIPEIAKATKAKDRVLREMADEVLNQIARGSNAELSSLAKKYAVH